MNVTFVVYEDENLGVQYIAEYLKKHGHDVSLVFNPNQFNKAYGRIDFLSKIFDWNELNLEQVQLLNPDLVAFSCTTATYGPALYFAQLLRKHMNTPIMFGGVHAALVPEIILENTEVDMVCIGEGEEALLELANSFDKGRISTNIENIWFKDKNNIIKEQNIIANPVRSLPRNIDKYTMDRSFFWDVLPSNYRKNAYYLTARGCPYKCTYCGNEQKLDLYKGKGKFIRQLSVKQAIDDLIILKEQYNTKSIMIEDDIFTLNKKWLREFVEPYREKIGLPFTCFIHPKYFDDELGQLLQRGGCRLAWFGIQTGNEKNRQEILLRQESNEEIIRAADLCKKYDLKFMVDHIFDIPYDEDVMASFHLYTRIKPTMINCYNLLYFPKSGIIEHARSAGMLSDEDVIKINRGETVVYQTGVKTSSKEDKREKYQQYALLMTCIPLLPTKMMEYILSSPRWMRFFGKMPTFSITMVKVLLHIRAGHGFLIFTVIGTELFWMKEFIKTKLRLKFKRRKKLKEN